MSSALPSLMTHSKPRWQALLRWARPPHWIRGVYLLFPVTACLLPLAILFAAVSANLPNGYGQLALPLLAIATASLLAELAINVPWQRPTNAPGEALSGAASTGAEAPQPRQHGSAISVTIEERYRAFFDHAEDSLCDIKITPDGRFICLDINPHAEAVIGKTSASVKGLTPQQILGAEAGARITAALMRCMEQNGLRYEEIWESV